MASITLHHAVATMHAAYQLGHLAPLATGKPAGSAFGALALIVLVVIGVFLSSAVSAARTLAAVVAGFVRLAAAMIFIAIVVVIAAAVLMHL